MQYFQENAMAISNISINPPASSSINSIVSTAVAPSANGTQPSANQPASATVTLSAQGQQLSQGPSPSNQTQASQSNQPQTSNTVDTPITPNVVPQSKETIAAPGIQFMSGESKGGRVNTFA
jgi:hypothetical protein